MKTVDEVYDDLWQDIESQSEAAATAWRRAGLNPEEIGRQLRDALTELVEEIPRMAHDAGLETVVLATYDGDGTANRDIEIPGKDEPCSRD